MPERAERHAIEAFVQVAQSATASSQAKRVAFEAVIHAIETDDIRILMSFSPEVIIAELTEAQRAQLAQHPQVTAIQTGLFDDEQLARAKPELQMAMQIWNERVAAQRDKQAGQPRSPDEGLSWDAPGHLPPDPPREYRDLLRRREEEQQKHQDDVTDE